MLNPIHRFFSKKKIILFFVFSLSLSYNEASKDKPKKPVKYFLFRLCSSFETKDTEMMKTFHKKVLQLYRKPPPSSFSLKANFL